MNNIKKYLYELKWNFYLEYLTGNRVKGMYKEMFGISYPTVLKYFEKIEEFISSDKFFIGVCFKELNKNYVSQVFASGEYKTQIVKFSNLFEIRSSSNYISSADNVDEMLFRYYQRKYAIEKRIRVDNAVIITEKNVSVMINGIIFENLGEFCELNLKLISEAYRPELWIVKKSAENVFNEFKEYLVFTQFSKEKEFLVDFVDSAKISQAKANWGIYQYINSIH